MKEGITTGIIVCLMMVAILFSYTLGFNRGINDFVENSEMIVNDCGTISIYYNGDEFIHE